VNVTLRWQRGGSGELTRPGRDRWLVGFRFGWVKMEQLRETLDRELALRPQ
jgi:hypothetical protein